MTVLLACIHDDSAFVLADTAITGGASPPHEHVSVFGDEPQPLREGTVRPGPLKLVRLGVSTLCAVAGDIESGAVYVRNLRIRIEYGDRCSARLFQEVARAVLPARAFELVVATSGPAQLWRLSCTPGRALRVDAWTRTLGEGPEAVLCIGSPDDEKKRALRQVLSHAVAESSSLELAMVAATAVAQCFASSQNLLGQGAGAAFVCASTSSGAVSWQPDIRFELSTYLPSQELSVAKILAPPHYLGRVIMLMRNEEAVVFTDAIPGRTVILPRFYCPDDEGNTGDSLKKLRVPTPVPYLALLNTLNTNVFIVERSTAESALLELSNGGKLDLNGILDQLVGFDKTMCVETWSGERIRSMNARAR